MTTATKDRQRSGSSDFVESALYLLALDPKTLDTADLVTAIEGCGQLRGMVSAAEAGFITEYETRCGAHETAETLKRKQKLSARRAKRRTKTAKNTAGDDKVAAALKAGEISDEHADVLADAEEEHEGATDELLETAKGEGVDRFRQTARDWARNKDGHNGDSAATKQFKARKASSFIRDGDGMGITIAELDPTNHAAFTTALAYWVPKLFNQEQTPTLTADPVLDAALVARTSQQRLADALVAMAAASINPNNPNSPVTARMLIIANYDPLTQALTGRLADGTTLTPETVRRLGCEALILPAVFDGAGQPINLGRDARNVSEGQRALLAERDGGCRGCDMAPQWCHAHGRVLFLECVMAGQVGEEVTRAGRVEARRRFQPRELSRIGGNMYQLKHSPGLRAARESRSPNQCVGCSRKMPTAAALLVPGERPTAISLTASGAGYWIFINLGRAVTFGDAVPRGGRQ